MNSTETRLLLSESIWLESEHFEQARQIGKQVTGEANQWQTYLNILGSLAFEQWLSERIPGQPIKRDTNVIENITNLKLGDFKLCLITTEHLLDEVVKIPQVIEQPELAAHFYLVLEVLEEEEQVIIRGFLRYDHLVNYRSQVNLQPLSDGYYHLPFELFDPEPNHLLYYSHFLAPTSIPLPVIVAEHSTVLLTSLQETKNKLSRWLEGIFDETWQTIDALINPEANLAFSTRNHVQEGARRCKLIDMGMQLGNQKVALLMSITQAPDDKMGVLIQLHPTNGERFLSPDFKLTLLSKAGKILQEVQARSQDNYIQLKPFRGELGKRFSVEVSISDVSITEDFEL